MTYFNNILTPLVWRIAMINDRPASEELDQIVAMLLSVNSVDTDLVDYMEQWTREQWLSAFEVRNAITASSEQAFDIADYLLPTSLVPDWLRDILNQTWFRHAGSHPAPSWLTSIDHRIDWFALADHHPEMVLHNPYTQLITPTMMREAATLGHTRAAQVVTHAELGSGREIGTITCRLGAFYISTYHDPTLIVDITDIFGGITPDPVNSPGPTPTLNTATGPDTVYFGWEWFSVSWPNDWPTSW